MQPSDSQRRRWKSSQTLAGRTIIVVAIAGVISLSGAVLRLACVGRSCEEPVAVTADVPYCRLRPPIRDLVSAGFRDGRSPNIGAVTALPVAGGSAFDAAIPWPDVDGPNDPLGAIFSGIGFSTGADIGTIGLDQIAPTIAEAMGLDRPHPEVRSGIAVSDTVTGDHPSLVVEIVIKGLGLGDVQGSPALATLAQNGSSFTVNAGSAPADPAALLTTIGTGGLPQQHGITGTLLRNDSGKLVEAWGRQSPVSVIAGLGDDLDELTDQRAEIGLVAADPSDQGLIGGNWYINNDRDDLTIVAARRAATEVARLLRNGYGQDGVADLLAVTLEGDHVVIADAIESIVSTVEQSTDTAAFVVTTTGAYEPAAELVADELEQTIETDIGSQVIEATAPGGFFIDQAVLADEGISEDDIVSVIAGLGTNGTRVFADVFPAIAVSFERYC